MTCTLPEPPTCPKHAGVFGLDHIMWRIAVRRWSTCETLDAELVGTLLVSRRPAPTGFSVRVCEAR